MNDLIVFSIIRNGIENGYPFVEAYSSWFDFCDQVFVLDGCSTDGTDMVLRQLSSINSRFVFDRAEWPQATSTAGGSIAAFTNRCLQIVRAKGRRLLYIQADEILEPATRRRLAMCTDGAVELTRYILFWNSFSKVIRFENDQRRLRSTAWRAIKLFPATADIRSTCDGLSFAFENAPIERWEDEVFHYGWNFPVNILQKHAGHERLYSENGRYRRRAELARKLLSAGRYDVELLDRLDPGYGHLARPFMGTHPQCVRHLVGCQRYDPYVALSLLQAGVGW